MLRRLLLLLPAFVIATAAGAQSMPSTLPMGGVGGGGLSSSSGSGVFLKLDASNDPMTGPLGIVDGTSAAPGLAFGSKRDAGLSLGGTTIVLGNNTGGVRVEAVGAASDITLAPDDDFFLTAGDNLTFGGDDVLWAVADFDVVTTAGDISLDSDLAATIHADDTLTLDADTLLSIDAPAWTIAVDTAVALSGGLNGLNFDSDTLSIDALNNRVGIGTAAPTVALQIVGALTLSGNTILGDAVADTVTSNAGAWSFPNDSNIALGGGVGALTFDTSTLIIDSLNNTVGIGFNSTNDDFFIGTSRAAAQSGGQAQNFSASGFAAWSLSAQTGGFARMALTGTTWAASGYFTPNTLIIQADSTVDGGIAIAADDTNAEIDFLIGAGERLSLGVNDSVFNDQSANISFRVESENLTHALYVDAPTDRVGINDSSPDALLDVGGTFTADGVATLGSTLDVAGALTVTGQFNSIRNANNALYFQDSDAGADSGWWYEQAEGSTNRIRGLNNDAFTTFNNYERVTRSTTSISRISWLTGAATSTEKLGVAIGEVVVNEASGDVDFRVESDGSLNALFVDAGNNRVGVLNAAPGVAFDVTGTVRASTVVHAGAGSAGAPSFAASTDATSGMYSGGAGILAWAIAGVKEIDLDTDRLAPRANAAIDLGTPSLGWGDVFVDNSIEGTGAAKALTITDGDGLLLTTASGNVQITSQGRDIVLSIATVTLPQLATTTYDSWVKLPGSVYSGPGSAGPTCSNDTHAGRMFYVDRVGDGVAADVCLCVADTADSYNLRRMSDLSAACDPVP